MKKIIFTLIFTGFIFNLLAQNKIYWAQKVIEVSSEYSRDKNSAEEILGVPNVDPKGRKSPYAWAVEPNELDKENVETAYVILDFGEPKFVNTVAVFQSFNPGAVSLIYISDGYTWKLVYVDTLVIKKSGLPDEDIVRNSKVLQDQARTIHRSWNIFKKDSLFLADTNYYILNVKFPYTKVSAVKIVINPLAIDGWNQIDAVAIADIKKGGVKYPKPVLADQSLILEPSRHSMQFTINTKTDQINPVLYPDGKRIYFTENVYLKDKHFYTQEVKYSDFKIISTPTCNKDLPKNYKKEKDIWEDAKSVGWSVNSPVPKAVIGFSANGDKMFLTNVYKPNKKQDASAIFNQNTSGLAVSVLDTTVLKQVYTSKLEYLDTNFVKKVPKAYLLGNDTLFFIKLDTNDNSNYLYLMTLKGKKWSKKFKLGKISEHHFYLNEQYRNLWISVDSIYVDTFRVYSLKWGKPKELKIEGFKNYSNYVNFNIAIDDSVMFLSICDTVNNISPDSSFYRDLYISFYDKERKIWKKPIKLPDNINTLADESAPFLDGDHRTLFFASNGHHGYGGYDIYMTTRLDDTWLNWSEPLNLGDRINTPGDEEHFFIDQNSRNAYFISNDNDNYCKIQSDVFYIKMGKPITIHLKGITRNYNNDNKPMGNVTVSLEDIINGEVYGRKNIVFKSNQNGEFDVLITKLVEANKMSEFAYKARKGNYAQCTEDGDSIEYVYLNLTDPPWTVNIYQDLYLLGPHIAQPGIIQGEIEEPTDVLTKVDTLKQDTIAQEEEEFIPEEPKEVQKWAIIPIFDTIGCPVIYHRGQLFAITFNPDDPLEPSKALRIPVSYQKFFKYNQTDISINEKEFQKLIRHLDTLLSRYKSVNVYIVASASKVPTRAYCSNFELARHRAEEPEKRIIKYMISKGLDTSRVYFDKRYIVQGEEYQNDPENVKKYQKYQFVKIWLYSCSDMIEGKKED